MTRFLMVSPKNAHEIFFIFFFAEKNYYFLAAVAADRVQGEDTHGKKGTKVTLAAAAQKKL